MKFIACSNDYELYHALPDCRETLSYIWYFTTLVIVVTTLLPVLLSIICHYRLYFCQIIYAGGFVCPFNLICSNQYCSCIFHCNFISIKGRDILIFSTSCSIVNIICSTPQLFFKLCNAISSTSVCDNSSLL